MKYSTDRPAKIVVFAVDEGILQVAKYKTPDPLAYFFQKRAGGEDGADPRPAAARYSAPAERRWRVGAGWRW